MINWLISSIIQYHSKAGLSDHSSKESVKNATLKVRWECFLIHWADPQSRLVVITIFTNVRSSVYTFLNLGKRLSSEISDRYRSGLRVWPSGSLMTPVLYGLPWKIEGMSSSEIDFTRKGNNFKRFKAQFCLPWTGDIWIKEFCFFYQECVIFLPTHNPGR